VEPNVTAKPWTYRPSLDGLRTLAMYLIILFHANVAWASGTFIAVNLFFVLSGYLVTNVILNEIDKSGTLRLSVFYARRVRRLLPAALVAIVGISLLVLRVFPVSRRLALVGDAQSALLYVANWRFIDQAADYFATDVDKSPFLHFWTLGIEEQFYVVFPLVILLLVRFGRRGVMSSRAVLMSGLGIFLVLSLVAQFYWAGVDDMHAYFGTDARLYQLVAGCMLAVGFRYWSVRLSPRMARATALTGLGSFLLLSFAFADMSQSMRGVWGTLACVLLIAGLMEAEDQPLGRLMSRPTPVYLGKVSYATYLWHWPAILAIKEVMTVSPLTLAVIAAVISTAMASASAELLEIPIRSNKRLDRFKWRTVVIGVTTSVLVAVAVVPVILESERRPALAMTSSSATPSQPAPPTPRRDEDGEKRDEKDARPERLPDDVDWKEVEEDKGDEHTCDAGSPQDCVVVEGGGPHVMVIGDSHARMMSGMFEKIARENGFTLSMNVLAGCPWQENLKNLQSGKERTENCEAARVGWYDEVLPEVDPDVVILAGFPRDGGKWEKKLAQRDGAGLPLQRAVKRATNRTLRKIDAVADRTLLIESVAVPQSFEPNECLTSSADPADCAYPAPTENRPTDGFYLAAAAAQDDVVTVNLNPAFCPTSPVCQSVFDGTVVYTDREHLTATYAEQRWKQAWKLLRRSGVFDDTRLAA
jgi:peptidoglycan/LPS O-acetylase OafA/YrhL